MELLVKHARLLNRKGLYQIAVHEGKIASIQEEEAGSITDVGDRVYSPEHLEQVIDAEGLLLLPPYVESHIHLDAVLTAGEPRWNESGTLFEGIQIWSERKPFLTEEDIRQRALLALQWLAGQGVLHVRTHVDICDPQLTALKSLLALKNEVSSWVNVQIVAFPQMGICSYPNGAELLEEALKLGADAAGAIPHYEFTREDGVQSLHILFELAQKYDKLIDVHCDEIDDEQSRFVEVLAALAYRTGLKERVTASHTTAMHSYSNAYVSKLMNLLKLSEINFVANPLVNTHLQGRFDPYPKRRGMTRIKELLGAGLNVSLGTDCIIDPWYPLGNGNMLQVANMALHVGHMTGNQEIPLGVHMVTEGGARSLNIMEGYGIEVGKPANFIIADGQDPWELIRRMPVTRHVVYRGKRIASTNPSETALYIGETSQSIDLRNPFIRSS
ncbi:cytosine deaminase [Paenibacillus beijingensis]|uniref:Cytosine deaminase n=1 Tax=Paenibacillus beijingensis TaxID=1126833 RepID=A0A0D5NHU0_9BACL|nr:cytosine deaminase [Paenibacillus beijingensis]AJY74836.1 cytosine deaminase [Paenibacillus beijingensis]